MDDRFGDKKWLIEVIEDRTHRPIKRSRLLYRYDELNKVNFHQYFDNHPHIVLLIRTENEKIIGAYCKEAFKVGQHSTEDGIIFSCTEKIFFGPNLKNKSYKANTYDEYYIMFGNSELRIRSL